MTSVISQVAGVATACQSSVSRAKSSHRAAQQRTIRNARGWGGQDTQIGKPFSSRWNFSPRSMFAHQRHVEIGGSNGSRSHTLAGRHPHSDHSSAVGFWVSSLIVAIQVIARIKPLTSLQRSRTLRPYLWGTAVLVFSASPALAQDGAKTPSEVVFLLELLVLVLVGRLLGEAMHRIGQPSIMGQLIAGVLLGPSV